MMTIAELKRRALAKEQVSLIDFFALLAFVTQKPKSFLFGHDEYTLSEEEYSTLQALLARRTLHEPVSYLTHHKEFFGRDFFVDKRVLIPRPETELLIEQVLSTLCTITSPASIVDIGTGSGAIILTLEKELAASNHVFLGTDISKDALAVAEKNKEALGCTKTTLLESNLLENIPESYFRTPLILIANLPYVPQEQYDTSMPDVHDYEPALALVSGVDGLDHYRALIEVIQERNITSFTLFLEIDSSQSLALKTLLENYFPTGTFTLYQDLAGLDRIIKFTLWNAVSDCWGDKPISLGESSKPTKNPLSASWRKGFFVD